MAHELDPRVGARVVDDLVTRADRALTGLDELEVKRGVEVELIAAQA
ncbi:hypothetical protein [Solirubrobacter soli]|nr:hypothetical protein [Solirubrobacter soli]